jgi:signal transduction histidine kinase
MNVIKMFDILEEIPAIADTMLCHDVAEEFRALPAVCGFAVLDKGHPTGVIARDDLLIRLASQYGHAVYGKRPIRELMNNNPLVAEIREDLDEVERRIADGYSHALSSGFIIVEDGEYLGMGTALSLVRKNVERTRLRNQQLEKTTEEARHANVVKSQFLASMSHELRTPMNVIIGFAELITSQAFGPVNPPRYLEYADDILDSGRHLLTLINDILDMSKIEAGRFQLENQPIDINTLAANATKMCRSMAAQKNIELLFDAEPSRVVLIGDERALKQILLNLISNGLKYTSEGGRVLVQISQNAAGGVTIRVIDNGIGIAEEDLEKVLEPFMQAKNQKDNKTEGTGLGLSIVKALADLHEATLKVESVIDEGTTVHLNFPPVRVQVQANVA